MARGVAVRPAVGLRFLRRARWLYPSVELQIETDTGMQRLEFNVGDSIVVNGGDTNWYAILEGIGHRRGDLKKRIELKVRYLETPHTLMERLGSPRDAKAKLKALLTRPQKVRVLMDRHVDLNVKWDGEYDAEREVFFSNTIAYLKPTDVIGKASFYTEKSFKHMFENNAHTYPAPPLTFFCRRKVYVFSFSTCLIFTGTLSLRLRFTCRNLIFRLQVFLNETDNTWSMTKYNPRWKSSFVVRGPTNPKEVEILQLKICRECRRKLHFPDHSPAMYVKKKDGIHSPTSVVWLSLDAQGTLLATVCPFIFSLSRMFIFSINEYSVRTRLIISFLSFYQLSCAP